METALVLGANGFIGQNLVSALISDGFNVIGYGRSKVKNKCSKFIEGNFVEESRFLDILNTNCVDVVFHLISTTKPSENDLNMIEEVNCNIIPTIKLLDAMMNSNCKKIIFVSSGGTVYGEAKSSVNTIDEKKTPQCTYGLQKLLNEEILLFYNRLNKLDCRIARISNPYGINNNRNVVQGIVSIFVRKLYEREEINLFGNTVRDYIYIDDAIEALILFAKYKGEKKIFNIGSGQGVLLSDIVKLIESISHKSFFKVNHFYKRSCDVEKNILDIDETVKELNWKPKTFLENGIKIIIDDYISGRRI